MALPEKRSPAPRGDAKDRADNRFEQQINITSRRELETLARRLHACGPRAVYEFIADLVRGRAVSETLNDFGRLDPAVYVALAAILTDGGRA